jgi:uncharacterized membrane protein
LVKQIFDRIKNYGSHWLSLVLAITTSLGVILFPAASGRKSALLMLYEAILSFFFFTSCHFGLSPRVVGKAIF